MGSYVHISGNINKLFQVNCCEVGFICGKHMNQVGGCFTNSFLASLVPKDVRTKVR